MMFSKSIIISDMADDVAEEFDSYSIELARTYTQLIGGDSDVTELMGLSTCCLKFFSYYFWSSYACFTNAWSTCCVNRFVIFILFSWFSATLIRKVENGINFGIGLLGVKSC
jgi:hypothetical protein